MVGALILSAWAMAQDCHYQTWAWSVREKRPVEVQQVATFKAKLTAEERGPYPGCSVCEEDQQTLRVADIDFKVCRAYADRFQKALKILEKSGFPFKELEGYRVGRTKGDFDARGWRTQFSHHSYGVALDINASLNGLYENCVTFTPACRLLRGGPYSPAAKGTVTKEVAELFKAQGLRWGGELVGLQKDFMHFSPSGD